MSKAIQVTFDCHDPRAQALFWAEVLGYVVSAPPGAKLGPNDDPFDAWVDFIHDLGIELKPEEMRGAIEDPEGRGPRVFFQIVPEDKVVKNRVHLDVRIAPGTQGEERMEALETECSRLIALGARKIERTDPAPPMEAGFIVMADPEGNEFCLD